VLGRLHEPPDAARRAGRLRLLSGSRSLLQWGMAQERFSACRCPTSWSEALVVRGRTPMAQSVTAAVRPACGPLPEQFVNRPWLGSAETSNRPANGALCSRR